jgi:hypothetical protein
VPLAGVWLQDWSGLMDYAGGQQRVEWNWQLNTDWYGDWDPNTRAVRESR